MKRRLIPGLLFALAAFAQPARIVSTSPSITETLFALGLGDRVVGVSTYCHYPPAVLRLAKIGTFIKPDAEKIAVLRPDLVVVQRAKSPMPLPGKLAALGIRYVEVEPGSLAEVYTLIQDIGHATGVEARAAVLVASIRARLDAVRAESGTAPKPSVLMIVGRDPGMLSNLIGVGPGAYLDELIGVAGGKNMLADTKLQYPHISMETVLHADPDIILDAGAMGTTQNDGSKGEEELKQPWMSHRELKAVRNRTVFGLTSETLVVPGPRVVDAVELIRKCIRGGAAPAVSPLVEVSGLAFAYGSNVVLKSVGFSANPGEFVALLGLNGAGKSTILDIMAGLRTADSGSVRVDGRELKLWNARDRARWISHLPQGIRSDLPFTVEQIVLMGRYVHADQWFESEEDVQHAVRAMESMQCLAYRHRNYYTLSGGERQRVLLAACLAQEPKVLLFDEPSTYLDVQQQLQCFSTLTQLAEAGALCVAVTHDLNLALAHCTRLLVLHEGQIAADTSVLTAAQDAAWLSLLSPRLRLTETPEGRPWVVYR